MEKFVVELKRMVFEREIMSDSKSSPIGKFDWQIDKIENIFRCTIAEYGYECFANRKKAAALCNDIFVKYSRECKMLRMLFSEGIFETFGKVPFENEEERQFATIRIKKFLDNYSLDENVQEGIATLLVKSFSAKRKPSARMKVPSMGKNVNPIKVDLRKNVLRGTYIGHFSDMKLDVIKTDTEWYYIFPTPWNDSLEYNRGEEFHFLPEESNKFHFATVVSKTGQISLGANAVYPLLNTKHDGIIKSWDDKSKTAVVSMKKTNVDFAVIIDGVASKENIKAGDEVDLEMVCVSGKAYGAYVRRKQKYRVVPVDVDYVNLELESGENLRCSIIVVLEIKEKNYIYLLPEEKNNSEVFIYQLLSTSVIETTSLMYIETDEEYELAAAEFDKYLDTEEDKWNH